MKLTRLLPLILFMLLAAVFVRQLYKANPNLIPSALIGKPAPLQTLEPIEGLASPGITPDSMKGRITLVNVFASWCTPCRQEHPQLMKLAQDTRLTLIGINYKDTPEKVRQFLEKEGNPFAQVGADPAGRASVDWGVYGIPETFLLNKDGIIVWKFIGPLFPDTIESKLRPEIEKLIQPEKPN